jgi:hypothetical protein
VPAAARFSTNPVRCDIAATLLPPEADALGSLTE